MHSHLNVNNKHVFLFIHIREVVVFANNTKKVKKKENIYLKIK